MLDLIIGLGGGAAIGSTARSALAQAALRRALAVLDAVVSSRRHERAFLAVLSVMTTHNGEGTVHYGPAGIPEWTIIAQPRKDGPPNLDEGADA